MGKFADNAFYDAAFNVFKAAAGTVTETLCSAQPANFAGIAAVKLASVALNKATDITIANGDTSGRKMTISAKTGVAVTATGTGTHVVIDDGTNIFVTTTSSQAVSSGGTVDIGAWKDEIAAPA